MLQFTSFLELLDKSPMLLRRCRPTLLSLDDGGRAADDRSKEVLNEKLALDDEKHRRRPENGWYHPDMKSRPLSFFGYRLFLTPPKHIVCYKIFRNPKHWVCCWEIEGGEWRWRAWLLPPLLPNSPRFQLPLPRPLLSPAANLLSHCQAPYASVALDVPPPWVTLPPRLSKLTAHASRGCSWQCY